MNRLIEIFEEVTCVFGMTGVFILAFQRNAIGVIISAAALLVVCFIFYLINKRRKIDD